MLFALDFRYILYKTPTFCTVKFDIYKYNIPLTKI